MKYLKKFESNNFDIQFALSKIKEEFSDTRVSTMYDEEIKNWVDFDWDNNGEYKSEHEWYMDHNNNEAQDVVISSIISWYKRTSNKDILDDDYSELFDTIKTEYKI